MSLVPGGKKTAVNRDGLQKIHSVFDDGTECVEEFDQTTQLLVSRRWKRVTRIGRAEEWEVEVGEPPEQQAEVVAGMFAARDAPVVTRTDLEEFYVFKITNMPWDESNYLATVEGPDIVLRTNNRKYFKRLQISDLVRNGIPLAQAFVRIKHQQNTLVVFYKKPPQIMVLEKAAREARMAKIKNDGDVQCPAQ